MDVNINKNEKTVEWNTGEKTIIIHNEYVLYAFKHGKEMLMIKEKYDEISENGFSTYDKKGDLVFSYKYLSSCIAFRERYIDRINGKIISVDYDEKRRKLVVLKEADEIRSLLIYDEKGDLTAEIISPKDHTFVSLKNNAGNVMVTAQGTNDMTKDTFGRNDWNFIIDFENFCVHKKSITQ